MSNLTMHAKVAALTESDRPDHLVFRPLTVGDLPAVASLHEQVYSQEGVGKARDQIDLFWSGAYGELLPGACLGAFEGSSLLGVVLVLREAPLGTCRNCPFIAELFVDRKHRRKGVAAALVSQVAQACEEMGLDSLLLRLDMGKAPEAVALYEYLGFDTLED